MYLIGHSHTCTYSSSEGGGGGVTLLSSSFDAGWAPAALRLTSAGTPPSLPQRGGGGEGGVSRSGGATPPSLPHSSLQHSGMLTYADVC
jgi:hypothetical protein